jgi:hypothetical protein
MTFTATSRPCRTSRARYTVAAPPRPSSRTMSYCPVTAARSATSTGSPEAPGPGIGMGSKLHDVR